MLMLLYLNIYISYFIISIKIDSNEMLLVFILNSNFTIKN